MFILDRVTTISYIVFMVAGVIFISLGLIALIRKKPAKPHFTKSAISFSVAFIAVLVANIFIFPHIEYNPATTTNSEVVATDNNDNNHEEGSTDSSEPVVDSTVDELPEPEEETEDEEFKTLDELVEEADERNTTSEEQQEVYDKLFDDIFDPEDYETGVTFDNLARTPDEYMHHNVKFSGEVIQLMEGDGFSQVRLAVDGDYDNIALVEYNPDDLDYRLLEDDWITTYGFSYGLHSYETVLGDTKTIPVIISDKVEMVE